MFCRNSYKFCAAAMAQKSLGNSSIICASILIGAYIVIGTLVSGVATNTLLGEIVVLVIVLAVVLILFYNIPIIWFVWWARHSRRQGVTVLRLHRCWKCKYNIEILASKVCPECGALNSLDLQRPLCDQLRE
jgi:hypothetical protein